MMEKAYSLFFYILFISVLFLPSTAAERALLQTAETEGEGRNDGNKIGVTPSRSKPAPSRTEFPSPSKPTPVRHITDGTQNPNKPALSCGQGKTYESCLPRNTRSRSCSKGSDHNCIKS